jgi:hypothetical protein
MHFVVRLEYRAEPSEADSDVEGSLDRLLDAFVDLGVEADIEATVTTGDVVFTIHVDASRPDDAFERAEEALAAAVEKSGDHLMGQQGRPSMTEWGRRTELLNA